MRGHQIQDVIPGDAKETCRPTLRDPSIAQEIEYERFPRTILDAVQRVEGRDEVVW
jgi:hypothetical protein